MNRVWARTLSAPGRPVGVASLEAVVAGGDVLPEEIEAHAPAPLEPLCLGAGEALPQRRFRAAQAACQRLSHGRSRR